ncbi:MAG: IS110 family transposase, partial [Rhizobiaceae bacterium]
MKRFVGLDVAEEECAVCILDEDKTCVIEGSCPTDRNSIFRTIADHGGPVEKIVHESGPLSIWLTRELAQHGAPVVCVDARVAHKALSARMNKLDRFDAETLAQLARTDWYREVHIKSEESDRLRLPLSARERLIRIRMDIEDRARGTLKTFGIRLGPARAGWSRRSFRDQLAEVVSGDSGPGGCLCICDRVRETVCTEATALDAEIQQIAKDSSLAR